LKSSGVIGEDAVDGELMDFDSVGGSGGYVGSFSWCRCCSRPGGADVLMWLGHVPLECFICIGAISCCQCVEEALPRRVCTSLDGRDMLGRS
jgi:hypothetical protein